MRLQKPWYSEMTGLAKSVIVASAGFLLIAGIGTWILVSAGTAWSGIAGSLLLLLALFAGTIALGGLVVLYRHRRLKRGELDLFIALQQSRRETRLEDAKGFRAGIFRRLLARLVLGHDLLPGDLVQVRSLPEILAMLDEHGCMDGLPFQPEMVQYCGKHVRIFRCLDKIYDYGRTKQMRRLDRCVLTSGLRCDASAHGECQARCYLIWRTEWLRRVDSRQPPPLPMATPAIPAGISAFATAGNRYRCQFTELHAASREFPLLSLRRDLVPLLSGNYSFPAWLTSMLTRVFNFMQRLRGGLCYPPMPPMGDHASPLCESLKPGDEVRVLPISDIARTLDRRGKNRGLWFDVDMIKHCGMTFTVNGRVEKIIDDATGLMRTMKTPCITLDGIDYSGEGLNFNSQHDPTFWREYWLQRVDQVIHTAARG